MRRKRAFSMRTVLAVVLTVTLWFPVDYANALVKHKNTTYQRHTKYDDKYKITEDDKRLPASSNHHVIPNNLTQLHKRTILKLDAKHLPVQNKRQLHDQNHRNRGEGHNNVLSSNNNKKIELFKNSSMQRNETLPERKKRKADPLLRYGSPRNDDIESVLAARRYVLSQRTNQNDQAFPSYALSSSSPSTNTFFPAVQHSHLSPFVGEERTSNHIGLRNRLLEALARRINERNLYMREHGISPEQLNEDSMFEQSQLSNNYPLESSIQDRHTLAAPFRERLLAANGMRQLHELHHQHPLIDPRLFSGDSTADDSSIFPQRHMFPNIGNLGDETMPFGSLGETKPEYIPVGRVSVPDYQDGVINQELANEEMSEFVPSVRPHKQKKTWVTDVNVYSKKKTDDINSFLNEDDNDPLDEYDPCEKLPCHNGGICKVSGNTEYICLCPRTFKGRRCEIRNRCHPNPCFHGSKCTETNTGFQCSCGVGFKGKTCKERNFCLPNPCMNDAVCTESSSTDGFSCNCKDGWYGRMCDQRRTACTPTPCQNHGHCFTDGSDAFECVCQSGTWGKLCEEGESLSKQNFARLFHDSSNENLISTASLKSVISTPSSHEISKSFVCEANPCFNGGACRKDVTQSRGYQCQCIGEFHGTFCEEKKCMCENGGTCIGESLEVHCACRSGYGGKACEEHTQCNEDTCLHGGICVEQVGGFHCKCDSGYKGQRCEQYDKCLPNPCLHGGVCTDFGDFFKCECKKGFKGKQCEDIDLCTPNPCHNGGQCFGYPGGFQCECLKSYSGKVCDQHMHCLSNPCSNGAECTEVPPSVDHPSGTFQCKCKEGFIGKSCEEKDFCSSSPCHNGGECQNKKDGFSCKCHQQNYGKLCQHINHCFGSPCKNNAKCISTVHDFHCECPVGFKGVLCDEADYCQPNPCKNAGFCTQNHSGTGFVCVCKEGYLGLTCEERNPCAPNPCVHGQCMEMAGGYLCNCTLGFKGPKCTEINRCEPSPCFHGGSCEEINGGVGYVCQCATGYKGEICEKKDLCHPNPCQNNGECTDNNQPYHGGNKYFLPTTAQLDPIQCNCAKGFRGDRCKEIDPCFPNPCKHNSQCIAEDHSPIKCNCSIGWKGDKCDAVDLCSPDPCRYGTHCIQTDEESYQCAKNLCTPNPCHNDGKCIVVNDEGYECACPKGWRGKHCDQQDSCYPNPCENGGICHDMEVEGFTCECPQTFVGNNCQIKERAETTDFCEAYPCTNGGTCIDTEGGFTCRCNAGFSGPFCEDSVCHPEPCENGGTCVPYYGIALCKCREEFTGAHCSEKKKSGTFQHSSINTVRMSDTMIQTKSDLPRVTEILKKSGANSPLLIERVEEILNSDADRMQELSPTSKLTKLPESQPTHESHATSPKASSKAATTSSSAPQVSTTQKEKSPLSLPSQLQQQQKETPTTAALTLPTVRISSTTQKTETMEIPTNTGSAFRPVVVIKTLDPCEPNPCSHSGVCVIRSNGVSECICRHGFSGPFCREIGLLGYSSAPKFFPNDECRHCDQNAICVNGHCICQQNYVGDGLECWAETDEDKDWICETSPCQNGGTCKPGRAKCVCRLGYVGKYCEKHCTPSVHLSFDSMQGGYVRDESGNNNVAVLRNNAAITYGGGKCDSGAALRGGDILFDGHNFQPKPVDAVTIACWVKLDTTKGIQSIFDTIGGYKSSHKEGQYHFEVDNAKLRWFHRNEKHETIFSVLTTEPVLEEGNWTHIVGTYNGEKHTAKIYVNGDVVGVERANNHTVYLSQDWDSKAGIGKHEHIFGNRLLRGMVDEFFIFPCSLPRIEILVLMHHCKIYWKANNKETSPKHEVADVSKVNTMSSVSSVDVATLKKNKNRFQNYVGYESEVKMPNVIIEPDRATMFTNMPIAEQITVSANQRYRIPKPVINKPIISEPKVIVQNPTNHQLINDVSLSNAMTTDALYKEVREMLAREHLVSENKRMQILPGQQNQDLEKKLAIQLKPSSRPRYHHAPVVRNENKDLPLGTHAYLDLSKNSLLAQVSKSSFPAPPQVQQDAQQRDKVNIAGPSAFFGPDSPPVIPSKKSPISYPPSNYPFAQTNVVQHPIQPKPPAAFAADPRWFGWSKGLASTAGGTHTNTHTNTLQRNDPGTANVGTKVKSSQNSAGKTSQQQQKYNIPSTNHQDLLNYVTMQMYPYMRNTGPMNNLNLNKQLDDQLQQRNLQQIAQNRNKIHSETHSHQWGYGNGQGNGNGVGTPGGSGSGGGWGAGGPLSQQINLPGWGGNPPDGPPWGDKAEEKQKEQQGKQKSYVNPSLNQFYLLTQPQYNPNVAQTRSFSTINNKAAPTFPLNARDVWNTYVAQKKQSGSEMHTDATNTVWTEARVNPVNPQNLRVQNHGYGYGNGNGDANGYGPGGGTGDAGGWGAGGPVKQETHLPGHHVILPAKQQQESQQHRNFIYNPVFSKALAQSIKLPLFSKTSPNRDKQQMHINQPAITMQNDFGRRSEIASQYQQLPQYLSPPIGADTITFIRPVLPSTPTLSNSFPTNTPSQKQRQYTNEMRESIPKYPSSGSINLQTQQVNTRHYVPTETQRTMPSAGQFRPSSTDPFFRQTANLNSQSLLQRSSIVSTLKPTDNINQQINVDAAKFLRETNSLQLPESVRRQIIYKAIHDALSGLKKKRRKKRKIKKKK